ncbi:4-hydroxy-tetrahydrodipicolinate synthase [Pectinatus haikarae]|uniref:4-hydroxy-tetrahydrodipicolinate synthase n=1 Tax=Pectinatus haikarae TaxID=349096 RepID=A0ABT9YA42_9FIRM|nr:4-hydroxy-tetrahydrodipicolinate synthase [Pectinatus haikarae]MDQ0204712.1 4-hydroxy-tetrahydrodipicolinate synthase [Pectinatus haikarae]
MKKIIFKGSAVAIATPFTADGINYDELKNLIEFHISSHTDAIVIAGTSGEASTMTDDEHKEIIKFTVQQVKGRIPVIAGTGSNDTAYAVQLSQFAEEAGADAILSVTPYYNKCTQKGLIKHFTQIADNTNIPLVLYNVPSRTGVNIKPETYAELAKHPRIAAVKEANGDITSVLKTRALCGDELAVYSGNDDQIIPILSLGGQGVISVLSNIAPKTTHDICELYFSGNVEAAAKLQIDFEGLISALFSEVNPIPVKTALKIMGYDMGELRMPLTELEPANYNVLKALMKKHNIIR